MTSEATWRAIVESLRSLLEDDDHILGDLEPSTALGQDLGLGSVQLIDFLVKLETQFPGLNFQDLAQDGVAYRQDLTLGELHEYVLGQLAGAGL